MTTKTMERGRVKCHQYWEPEVGEMAEHGNFQVKTTAIDSNENWSVASLELKNTKTDEIRSVSHWQFTSWRKWNFILFLFLKVFNGSEFIADYGTPGNAMAMLTFLKQIREKQAEMLKELGDTWAGHPRGPPMVVHCSAGIGRTGKFN